VLNTLHRNYYADKNELLPCKKYSQYATLPVDGSFVKVDAFSSDFSLPFEDIPTLIV